mgnify:CR=1 FL=1
MPRLRMVHHAGHGGAGAAADGDQQGIFLVAQLLAGHFLQLVLVEHDLVHDLGRDLLAIVVVADAGLSGDGKALRHRQADVAHLGQVGTLSAEELTHIGIALAEKVNILLTHYGSS